MEKEQPTCTYTPGFRIEMASRGTFENVHVHSNFLLIKHQYSITDARVLSLCFTLQCICVIPVYTVYTTVQFILGTLILPLLWRTSCMLDFSGNTQKKTANIWWTCMCHLSIGHPKYCRHAILTFKPAIQLFPYVFVYA